MCGQLDRLEECMGCQARRRCREEEEEELEELEEEEEETRKPRESRRRGRVHRRHHGAAAAAAGLVAVTAASVLLSSPSSLAGATPPTTTTSSSSTAVIAASRRSSQQRLRRSSSNNNNTDAAAFVSSGVGSCSARRCSTSTVLRVESPTLETAAAATSSSPLSANRGAGRRFIYVGGRGGARGKQGRSVLARGRGGGGCDPRRPPLTVLQMVSAAGSSSMGDGFSGEFLPSDDSWRLLRSSQHGQPGSRGGSGGSGGGSSPEATRVDVRDGGAAVPGADSGHQGLVSWTPKLEGQGSWDKNKAAAASAGLEAPVWRVDLVRGVHTGIIKIKQPLGLDLTDCNGGVCVSNVHQGLSADRQGIRAGDRVVATSATLGDVLWEKKTVDGILSAVGTRLVFSDTVTLRVERPLEPQQLAAARFKESVTQTYELTLERPPGLILEQIWSEDGSGDPVGVLVAGITPGSPADVSGVVERGDRVVAVSNNLGNIMWPYRRLEGVLSAIETHKWNTVNLRFERVVEMGAWTDPSSTEDDATIDSTLRKYRKSDTAVATATVPAPARRRPSPAEAATAAAAAAATNAGFVAGFGAAASDGQDETRLIVLERCGALVRSYGARKQAIAVDNLLESMEKAGVQMNPRFLNSALISYLLCGEAQKAVDTFHAVTGIVWPSLPPSANDQARAKTRRVDGENKKKKSRAAAAAAFVVDPPPVVAERATTPGATSSSEVELPEEFRLLKAGPPPADDAMWNGTGGHRFLQMREVNPAAYDDGRPSSSWQQHGDGDLSRGGGGGVAVGVPLKKPALGEYVGGCRPNELLVATVVKAHGRRRRLDDACRSVLRMTDWGLKPDVAVFNSLAAAAVWNGRMDLAIEVVLGGTMTAWGVSPNQLSYNTIMDAYARAGNVKNVVKIYNFMQREGVAPDVVTTTILVKAQVGGGNVTAAVATLVEMMKVSTLRDSLDAFPFNTIIQGLTKTLQWEKALDLFRSMQYQNVKPDLLSYNSIIACLVKAHRPSIAIEVFEEMADVGVLPDVYTYSTVVSAYAKMRDVASAVRVLSDMAKNGVKPNGYTCSAVMQACVRGGQPGTALEVHEQLIAKGGIKEDVVIRTLVVQANAMTGDFDEAFRVITAMGKYGQDTKVPFNHLVKECVLAGEWGRALEAVKRMLHQGNGGKGVRFDHNTFNAVSTIPRGYDGTEEASWPRLRFLMETKDMVTSRGWTYSSTLYLAILDECTARQDYVMASMIAQERESGSVFVHPADRERVERLEETISFKMLRRTGLTRYMS